MKYAPFASVVTDATALPCASVAGVPSGFSSCTTTPANAGSPASWTPFPLASTHVLSPMPTTIGVVKPMSKVWLFWPAVRAGMEIWGYPATSVAFESTDVLCEPVPPLVCVALVRTYGASGPDPA